MKKNKFTQREAVAAVAEELDAQISFEAFVQRVLELWPSKAKNPQVPIRETIRYELLGKKLLFQDEGTLIPIQEGMQGVRYRVPLTPLEIRRGRFFIDPAFQFYVNENIPPDDYKLVDVEGQEIAKRVKRKRGIRETSFKSFPEEEVYFDIAAWYRAQNTNRKDSVIVTILDWETAHYRFELEKQSERKQHRAEIKRQNQALADYLFNMLENEKNEYLMDRNAITHAYYKLKQEGSIAPDHWYEIIHQDPRMVIVFGNIRYADWDSPIAEISRRLREVSHSNKNAQVKPVDEQQAAKVYQFKAALKYNKRLWRRIEIQGGQTLGDLDSILKEAFQHDEWDHLSGFWKLVRRGETRRFRQVDLGTINPFEDGGAEEIQIASLQLTANDRLKYVYDFGDWIEHQLKLEDIRETEENVRYPRITGKNKPKYQHCMSCQEKGKETTATLICIDCSNRDQEAIWVCEECADQYHEDHYLDEILY
jgi:hypothetical protein